MCVCVCVCVCVYGENFIADRRVRGVIINEEIDAGVKGNRRGEEKDEENFEKMD